MKEAFTKLQEQSTSSKPTIQQITLVDLLHLNIDTIEGSFVIQADVAESTLFYRSPFSGAYKYFYDIQEERFISNKDKHMFD